MKFFIQRLHNYLLLISILLGCFNLRANTEDSRLFYDSLSQEIKKAPSDKFFLGLMNIINNNSRLSKSQKLLLLDEAILASKEQNLELISAKLVYVKSINKTIEGDYATAFKLVQSKLAIFKELSPEFHVASYNTMGNMIARLGDTKLAISYLKRAMSLCDSLDKEPNVKNTLAINNYLVLGNIYFNDSQYNLASNYFIKADNLVNQLEDKTTKEKCFCLLNRGKVDIVFNQPHNAIQKCKKAEQIGKLKGYFDIEGYSYLRLGKAYGNLLNFDSSLYYYSKAEEVSTSHELNYILLDAYKEKSELFEQFNLFESSLSQIKKYISLQQELEEHNENAKANYLIAEAKKEEKIIAQRELEKRKEQENKLILLTSIIIVVLLFIIFLFWSRTQRIRLKNQIKKEQLDKIVVSSQLKAISSQMNPHFIFNCLNSIQDLVLQQDGTNAYNYIGKFALLIRKTLHHSEKDFIDIEDELSLLNLYLELEKLRFKEDFTYQINNNEVKDIQIPPMLIQPFVENAIKHGLLHKEGAKSLKVQLQLKNNILTCSVSDNGIGRKKAQEILKRKNSGHQSFTSKSVNDRFELLKKLHGGELGLNIVDLVDNNETPTGTIIELKLPFKRLY